MTRHARELRRQFPNVSITKTGYVQKLVGNQWLLRSTHLRREGWNKGDRRRPFPEVLLVGMECVSGLRNHGLPLLPANSCRWRLPVEGPEQTDCGHSAAESK